MTDNTPTPGGDRIKHNQNSELSQAKSRTRPDAGNAPGFGAVTIDFNPGPDAPDRLRRHFTLLVECAARERRTAPDEDSSLDARGQRGS